MGVRWEEGWARARVGVRPPLENQNKLSMWGPFSPCAEPFSPYESAIFEFAPFKDILRAPMTEPHGLRLNIS